MSNSLVVDKSSLIDLNLELQFRIKSLADQNTFLEADLEQAMAKLKNYEDLSHNLSDMRNQLSSITEAYLKKRNEAEELRERLRVTTEESSKKIDFLEDKVRLLSGLSCKSEFSNHSGSTISISDSSSLPPSDAENKTRTDIKNVSSNPKNSVNARLQRKERPLAQRLENRVLTRVRQCNQRKSISTEELRTAGKIKNQVLQAHLQMRGKYPLRQQSCKEPHSGPATVSSKVTPKSTISRSISSNSSTQLNAKPLKPFRF